MLVKDIWLSFLMDFEKESLKNHSPTKKLTHAEIDKQKQISELMHLFSRFY